MVLHFLAFNHVDFPRKFVRLFHGKNSSKRCVFHCLVVDNFDFTRKSSKIFKNNAVIELLPDFTSKKICKLEKFRHFMVL